MNDGVSVIMPAYNEEKNLEGAVSDAKAILEAARIPFEILVINDGSIDGTGGIAQELARDDPRVRVIHNNTNMGLGRGLRRGITGARMAYVTLYPSDNEMDKASFRQLLAPRFQADLVSAYMANPAARSHSRRIISAAFVHLMNILFGLHLRYFTGPFIAKTNILRSLHLTSDGVTILAELRVRLLARGASFKEIPFTFRMRKHGKATLFRWKTMRQTLLTVFVLLKDTLLARL